MTEPIQALLSLAQKLDDTGLSKISVKIDALVAKLAADSDDVQQVFQKQPKRRGHPDSPSSPWGEIGSPPLDSKNPSEALTLNQLPAQMRPKTQNQITPQDFEPGNDPTTVEGKEAAQDYAESEQVLALDKKYLLEDLAAAVIVEAGIQPKSTLNKTLAPDPFIRLEYEVGHVVLSAHTIYVEEPWAGVAGVADSAEVQEKEVEPVQHWVQADLLLNGRSGQMKFPLQMLREGGVSEELLSTMAQRIASKIESAQTANN